MPTTRAQRAARKRVPEAEAEEPIKRRKPERAEAAAAPDKPADKSVDRPADRPADKPSPDPPSEVSSGSATAMASGNNVQSSIPGMSIAQIRAVLGEQRKQFQETGYVDLVDEVCPGMTRMQFNYRYVHGIAVKRHAKHKRASAKQSQAV